MYLYRNITRSSVPNKILSSPEDSNRLNNSNMLAGSVKTAVKRARKTGDSPPRKVKVCSGVASQDFPSALRGTPQREELIRKPAAGPGDVGQKPDLFPALLQVHRPER